MEEGLRWARVHAAAYEAQVLDMLWCVAMFDVLRVTWDEDRGSVSRARRRRRARFPR